MTAKQARFVQEYLVDLNAAAAARRAGYKNPNIGRQLITKNNVCEAIQQGMQARSRRLCIDQDYVLEKLHEIADRDASDAPDSTLKYSAKLKALELLGRHLGLFDDRLRVTASIDTGKLDSILRQLEGQPGCGLEECPDG